MRLRDRSGVEWERAERALHQLRASPLAELIAEHFQTLATAGLTRLAQESDATAIFRLQGEINANKRAIIVLDELEKVIASRVSASRSSRSEE